MNSSGQEPTRTVPSDEANAPVTAYCAEGPGVHATGRTVSPRRPDLAGYGAERLLSQVAPSCVRWPEPELVGDCLRLKRTAPWLRAHAPPHSPRA